MTRRDIRIFLLLGMIPMGWQQAKAMAKGAGVWSMGDVLNEVHVHMNTNL
jgi:hypothetical protein